MFEACIIKKYSIDFGEHFRYCFERYQKSSKSSLKNIPSANTNPVCVKLFHKARHTDVNYPLNWGTLKLRYTQTKIHLYSEYIT